MKEKFSKDRDPQGLNLVEYSVTGVSGAEIIEQLHISPFMAEKRMVVLKHLCSSGSKELHTDFLPYVQEGKLPSDIIVIVWDEDPKPRAKDSKQLVELLAAQPYSKRFDVPVGKALESWILFRVQASGGTIDTTAIQYMMQFSTDMRQISNIVDQLVSYAAGRKITSEDIALFAPLRAEDNIFELVDTAIAGNTEHAFTLLREQYRTGKDAHYVFAMLLRQYRIMLDVMDVLDRRLTPDAKAMNMHPFVLKKTISAVSRYSFATVRNQYIVLLDIDKKIKTGSGDPESLIDVFIGSL
jgi:DNA polymerase-3 subunit delta